MYAFVLVFLAGIALGAGGVLVAVHKAYQRWIRLQEKVTLEEKPYVEPRPSEGTREFLEKHPYYHARQNDTMQPESMECFNVLFDFLFFQLRDTVRVKRHVLRSIDRNLTFLMARPSLGNICKRMKVIDLNLGSEMPHLSEVKIVRPEVGAIGSSDVLDLDAYLTYKGKVNVRIEADLIFQRTAVLSITVVELRGRGRFSFRSEPHPHWTFGFLEHNDEPALNLEVEALLENRSFPQLANIVQSQIKAALRKVHTIPAPSEDDMDGPPRQKMRYDPFFTKPLALADTAKNLQIDNQDIFTGRLTAEIIGCRHLQRIRSGRSIFVTLSLFSRSIDDEHEMHGSRDREIEVYKAGAGATIGIAFEDAEPRISAVKPGTPASGSGLRVGDLITAVNGIAVIKARQALKLIREAKVKVKLNIIRQQSKKRPKLHSRELRGRYSETRVLPHSENPTFKEVHTFSVTPSTPRLYIRVYDCKYTRRHVRTKRYLIGYAALDLEETALFCVANQSKLLKLKRLQAEQIEGSSHAGFIKLLLHYTPTPLSKAEAAPYPAYSRRPRATSVHAPAEPFAEWEDSTQGVGTEASSSAVADEDEEDMEDSSTAMVEQEQEEQEEEQEEEQSSQLTGGGGSGGAQRRRTEDTLQSVTRRVLDSSTDFDMFAEVPVAERRPKLEALMNELEHMLELEAITRRDIEAQMKLPDQTEQETERLKENLRLSDERRDFLHHRALKCASGIISCEEELSSTLPA